ncbi:MAG: hypothetical protein D6761_05080 [Candidatus Dadabacteria bacterium]|nr:MAG: hypothetical protein D6761_05080 [Candidatus Dadabacteria bacterium]
MPDVRWVATVAAAAVAVVQVVTLAHYVRQWLMQRRTVWLVIAHYGLTFVLLLWILRWSQSRGQSPVAIVAGYSVGLVVALSLALWKVQRAQAQYDRSEE